MAETVPLRDAVLLLDIALAAQDALSFVADLNEAGFLASRLYQNAVIRSLEIVGNRPVRCRQRPNWLILRSPGARSQGCAIA